jgi:hypothetical protein
VTFVSKNQEQADYWFYASDHHPQGFSDEKFGHLLHETIKKRVGNHVQFHFIPTVWNPQTYLTSVKLMNFLITMCPYTALCGYRFNSNVISIIDGKVGKDVLKISDLTAKKLQTRI